MFSTTTGPLKAVRAYRQELVGRVRVLSVAVATFLTGFLAARFIRASAHPAHVLDGREAFARGPEVGADRARGTSYDPYAARSRDVPGARSEPETTRPDPYRTGASGPRYSA